MTKIARPAKDVLCGMSRIEAFIGRDEATIRRLVAEEGFPAGIVAGRWMAIRSQVERWLSEQIAAKNGRAPDALTGKATRKGRRSRRWR